MKCPFCGHVETQVIETRIAEDADSVRRRRQCGACDKRFTTYERAEVNLPLIVKKDGRRVEYQRKKLFASMTLALRKRGVGVEQIDQSINRIEETLLAMGVKELASETLGEIVMQRLFELDKVAYIRFASVYKDFEDIEAFSVLAKELK